MAGNSIESGRSVTSKIVALLMIFRDGEEHTLTELARLTGLPMSTAHRLAFELASWRLLDRTDDGHYRIGLPLRMIRAGHEPFPSIVERGPCVLEDLSAALQTSARLGVLQDLQVAYIEKRPGYGPVSEFSRAATLPIHPTALGRALLAFSPAGTVEMVIAGGLKPYTPRTITAPERFRRALAITRLTKVAVACSELETGSSSIAVPVFGPGGRVVAAIEVKVQVLHSDFRRASTALSIAARSLSRELGTTRYPTTTSNHTRRSGLPPARTHASQEEPGTGTNGFPVNGTRTGSPVNGTRSS